MNAAQAGDRIVVSSGLYREQIKLDKAIHIRGAGPRSAITLEHGGKGHTLHCTAGDATQKARLENLTIKHTGSGSTYDAVHASQAGSLEVHECDLSSTGGAGLHIKGSGTRAEVTWCMAHHSNQSGFLIASQAFATLEDCTASDNGQAGYVVMEAEAELRRNIAVRNLGGVGVFGKGSACLLERNQLRGNRQDNLHIDTACKKNVTQSGNVVD